MLTAKKYEKENPYLDYGLILDEGPALIVRTSSGDFEAQKAVSCLIEPRPGDQVLVSMDSSAVCHVIAVLTRPDEEAGADLHFSGDVRMRIERGSLQLLADKDLNLAARDNMSLASESLDVNTNQANAHIEKLSFVGEFINIQAKRLKTVADVCEQFLSSLTQRLKSSFRSVEEHDESQAGSARYLVDGTMTVNVKNSVHIAEEDVKIDADQIHLG